MNTSTLPFPATTVWIGSDHPFDLHEAYLCFRSPANLHLPRKPEHAELSITADSRYKLWINGRLVGRGPGRAYPQQQSVDCLDVTNYLQGGQNTIAVQVYQPGYSHFTYLHRGTAGLLACLVCDKTVVLTSDTTWRTQRDRSFSDSVPRVSIYGSGVEERDLCRAEAWTAPTYDDSGWSNARLVAPLNGYPWSGLRQRSVPLLIEREQPMHLIETRQGDSPEVLRNDPHLALRQGWQTATISSIQPAEQPLEWQTISLGTSEARYWLFDLGRDYTCQGWAEIEGALGGEQLSICYAEKIRSGEIILPDPQTYCRVRITDRFTLRSGDQTVESFTLRGGRYLLFQLTSPVSSTLRIRFHARVSEYPLVTTHPLSSGDPLLTKIITLCEETLRACLQESFVDCIWRENSQWLGDALPESLILSAMSDDTRPLRQVIEMAAQGAYPDGLLPSVLPGEVHAYTIPRYNLMWVELLSLYQQLTGDDEFVAGLWPTLQKMLTLLYHYRRPDGLLISPPGWRFYVDWSPSSQQQPHAVYNLHFVLALQKAAQLADQQGQDQDALRWRQQAEDLQRASRAAFWQDGCWFDDLPRSTFSQLAAAFALLTHTVQSAEAGALLDAIVARSLDLSDNAEAGKMVLASPFMHHYLFEALRQSGYDGQTLAIIRLRWGRWVEAGYPTTWENWNVDFPDGSQCHAFSAHPRYHLAQIAKELGGI